MENPHSEGGRMMMDELLKLLEGSVAKALEHDIL